MVVFSHIRWILSTFCRFVFHFFPWRLFWKTAFSTSQRRLFIGSAAACVACMVSRQGVSYNKGTPKSSSYLFGIFHCKLSSYWGTPISLYVKGMWHHVSVYLSRTLRTKNMESTNSPWHQGWPLPGALHHCLPIFSRHGAWPKLGIAGQSSGLDWDTVPKSLNKFSWRGFKNRFNEDATCSFWLSSFSILGPLILKPH